MISLTEYAAHRGVSKMAVSKAVESGRLRDSVVRDDSGAPKIRDVELADREWAANTRPRARPAQDQRHTGQPPAAQAVGAAAEPTPPRLPPAPEPRAKQAPAAPARSDLEPPPDYQESRARREAAEARRASANADMAELDLLERRGELVPAEQARADVQSLLTTVRTKLLAVPSRVAQRCPELALQIVPLLDQAIREALEELAGAGPGGEAEA